MTSTTAPTVDDAIDAIRAWARTNDFPIPAVLAVIRDHTDAEIIEYAVTIAGMERTPAAPVEIPERVGFTRHTDGRGVTCYGANHRDSADAGTCDGCGADVARALDGRILDVVLRGERMNRKVCCWSTGHRCTPEAYTLHQARLAEQVASGAIVKGVTVEVFKGRKVRVGTVGIVRWVGEDRVGLAVEGTDGLVYTAEGNVRRTA